MSVLIPLPPEVEEKSIPIIPSFDPIAKFASEVNRIIEKYLETYSENTIWCYRNDMKTFFEIMNKNLMDVNELDIIDYVKELERRGFKNATINRKIYSLSKIFSIYKKLGLVKKNMVKEVSKTTRINKREKRRISLNIVKEDVIMVVNKANPRTALIIKALANTGLRISELINIKYTDIVLLNKDYFKIRIIGKGDKERFVYLSRPLNIEIRDVYKCDNENLFHSKSGLKLSRTNLYKQVSKAFKRHTGKIASPHSLRHFFPTYKIGTEKKDVKSVSNYLGHSRVSVTLEMYTHTSLSPEESHII